uniref:Zinc finger C2HC5-type domain-containing protein n=1 Tax=Acrobeloides nanus TaxID=290746 RepID=A0A914D5D7_9BILA
MSHKTGKTAKKVEVQKYDIESDLKPGRHPCECQARLHKLIINCMGCGRIVCEQEGSGPCFFCAQLVCTKEEQEILDRKSNKSEQLMRKLMGETSGLSLSAVSKSMQQAIDYRNKLLAADADTERVTRVSDLESDYYNLENNPYLTADERETIIARKEELRQMKMKREKTLVIDLDLTTGTAKESKRDENIESTNDPVIQAVLQKSRFRKPQVSAQNLLEEQRKAINEFVPKYDASYSSAKLPNIPFSFNEDLSIQDEESLFAEVERKGYCIALDQPLASFFIYGLRKHLPWPEDIRIKGPVLLAATATSIAKSKIGKEENLLKKNL